MSGVYTPCAVGMLMALEQGDIPQVRLMLSQGIPFPPRVLRMVLDWGNSRMLKFITENGVTPTEHDVIAAIEYMLLEPDGETFMMECALVMEPFHPKARVVFQSSIHAGARYTLTSDSIDESTDGDEAPLKSLKKRWRANSTV